MGYVKNGSTRPNATYLQKGTMSSLLASDRENEEVLTTGGVPKTAVEAEEKIVLDFRHGHPIWHVDSRRPKGTRGQKDEGPTGEGIRVSRGQKGVQAQNEV